MKEINQAWKKIAPFYEMQNLIACNPLQGFEDLQFDEALKQGLAYFRDRSFEKEMLAVNRVSIKWLQVIFGDKQAAILMPKEKNFFKSWLELAAFDGELKLNKAANKNLWQSLDGSALQAIENSLQYLKIKEEEREEFLTLILTTLPGFASLAKYLGDCRYLENWQDASKIKEQFLALRLVITALLFADARNLLAWHKNVLQKTKVDYLVERLEKREAQYQEKLLSEILANFKNSENLRQGAEIKAQLVFCIDVRSEMFRRNLESLSSYQTFGFAGFFAVPAIVKNQFNESERKSFPVLLKASCEVQEKISCCARSKKSKLQKKQFVTAMKKIYQSLKYNFSTPLALAEATGLISAFLMVGRTFFPKKLEKLGEIKALPSELEIDVSTIEFSQKIACAKGALAAIGLTKNFAPLVIFCGHGSKSENNAFASALDCGACGGNAGDASAKIIANILNEDAVRAALKKEGIAIPPETIFLGALHNTTTDAIEIYQKQQIKKQELIALENDLNKARILTNIERAKIGFKKNLIANDNKNIFNFFEEKSLNWSEVRPEWGLAGNAAFIIGKRDFTQNVNLQGRAFLHSYDASKDENGAILESILCAPMVVAQMINSQYLFSTLDNIAFGAGSKLTHNIVGKLGVMQGNASDLMNGLAMQSVFASDRKRYHESMRLSVIVQGNKETLLEIVKKHEILQRFFANSWLHLFCFDEDETNFLQLRNNLTWQACNFKNLNAKNEKIWQSL
jgi:uncharacterized protein YbcC (UPF0753/DUF2309 family)